MLILQLENLRNFLLSKDSIVVLTRIAWAAIVTSALMVSYDLQVKTWHSWLTFSFTKLISPLGQWQLIHFYDNKPSHHIISSSLHRYRSKCEEETGLSTIRNQGGV